MNRERFQDRNLRLYHFQERILVKCPKCRNRAEVRADPDTKQTVLQCISCHHQHTTDHVVLDLHLNVYCNQCAHRIHLHQPNVSARKQAITVRCPACGDTQTYQPTYTRHFRFPKTSPATDPYLGLELWYHAPFKSHILWAYNYPHLEYLEQYIGAKLRERHNRRYATMVEKLPRFMKSARNREALLKLIQKLKLR